MNKRELIEHISSTLDKYLKNTTFVKPVLTITEIAKSDEVSLEFEVNKNCILLDDNRQELNKPVVKQFVADWYEENKDNLEFNIFDYVYRFDQNAGFDFKDWFDDFNTKPIQTLVNMHQFGYEVEKEKLVKVKLKGTGQYLCNDDTGLHFQHGFKTDFTKDYLKKYGFGWVFDCPGVEIEEVE